MAHRRPIQRFHRPTPRSKVWVAVGSGQVTLVTNTNTLVLSLNAAALALRPFTVLRQRIMLHFESDQVAVSELTEGACGTIVVKDQAVVGGAGSIPDPLVDADAEWVMYQPMASSFLFGDGTGFADSGTQYLVDSKSMRKVNINEQFVFMARAALGSNLTIRGRTLLQLH